MLVMILELAEKSSNSRMAADDLEEEIRSLQAGEERRGSCVSQSNGCCFDSVMEQLFTLRRHARQQIQVLQEEIIRRFEVPATPVLMAGREEREESGKRSKRTERPVAKWVHKRQVGAMKTFWLVLLLIRMQTVETVEEEISIRQEMDRTIQNPTQTAATDARG